MVLFQGNKDWTLPAKTPKPHARWWDGYIYAAGLQECWSKRQYLSLLEVIVEVPDG